MLPQFFSKARKILTIIAPIAGGFALLANLATVSEFTIKISRKAELDDCWSKIQSSNQKVAGSTFKCLEKLNKAGEHDFSRINLEGYKLAGINLKGANLSEAILSDANLANANLEGVDLSDANLTKVNLRGANLKGAILNKTILESANLSGANLKGVTLDEANLRKAILDEQIASDSRNQSYKKVDLSETNLSGKVDFSYAKLDGLDLSKIFSKKVFGSEIILRGASLNGANLNSVNLSGANLSQAKLSGANLKKANLSDTDLSSTDLSEANLTEADLTGANLSKANLSITENSRISQMQDLALASSTCSKEQPIDHFNFSNPVQSWMWQACLQNKFYVTLSGTGAKLNKAILKETNLNGANLDFADFSDANLIEANLSQASLERTNFSNASLIKAKLIDSKLFHTVLIEANLLGANLSKAKTQEVISYAAKFGSTQTLPESCKTNPYFNEIKIDGKSSPSPCATIFPDGKTSDETVFDIKRFKKVENNALIYTDNILCPDDDTNNNFCLVSK